MSDVGGADTTAVSLDEADRQRVENQLLDAYAEGRLSDDEFDRRIRLAVEATAQGQLADATRDIPAAGSAVAASASNDDPVDVASDSPTSASKPDSTASTDKPAAPTNANPLSLDTEPEEFPAYPYDSSRTSSTPYGQAIPHPSTPQPTQYGQQSPYQDPAPGPQTQSPYGQSPYGATAPGAQVSPYGAADPRTPGRGYPVLPSVKGPGASKATAALAHFLALFTWIVGPGIIFAISPAGSDARKEAAKSFNFQVVSMLALIVTGVLSAAILPNWMDNVLMPLVWLGWLLGTIVGGAKAAQGEDWDNPVMKAVRLKILSEK